MIKKIINKIQKNEETTKQEETKEKGTTQELKIKLPELQTNNKPTWCPGCGDYGILAALKNALTQIGEEQQNIFITYGIGCHGHMCNYIHAYGLEGLHGRPIPVAEGAKIANDKLKVIVVAGDGDTYGEGLNHFINGIRANHDVTLIAHNNQVYGLTTGQTSPTSDKGYKSKSTPTGVIETPINPIALAISAGGTFVARGYAGNPKQLTELIIKGIKHDGFAVIDVLQNCESFNHHNTRKWYTERIYELEKTGYEPNNKLKALHKAFEWGNKIPTGIFYQETTKSYEDELEETIEKGTTLIEENINNREVKETLINEYT